MIIFPALDLMDGCVVRLTQGKAEARTVYSNTPENVAHEWYAQGAEWLHLVDLDGAFKGKPRNLEAVKKICAAVPIPCQLGGGLREKKDLKAAFDAGVARVIIGSKACESLDFIAKMVKSFGAERIAVGIDARDGKAATKGWVEQSEWDARELAQAVVKAGIKTIIYTDIATDGMLKGPNISAMEEMMQEVPGANIIASGGVSCVEDVHHLQELKRLHGIIIGKALYDQKVALAECLKKETSLPSMSMIKEKKPGSASGGSDLLI